MKVLIVGASLSGLRTAQALRAGGFDGDLIMAGAEDHLPYDRPPLSKHLLLGTKTRADVDLEDEETLAALNLDLQTGTVATGLDVAGGRVELAGRHVGFDQLVIATGARPRGLPFGAALRGVHTLREVDDCLAIREAMDAGTGVVVIGGGFIGSEVASAAVAKGLPTTLLEMLPTPLFQSLGPEIGEMVAGMQREAGIDVICGHGARALIDDGHGAVAAVELDDGRRLPAGLVVVGIGVVPETSWLEGSGLALDNGVVCDDRLRASGHDRIRAVGDVARWDHPVLGRPVRVEHWTNAAESAAHAAAGILGSDEPYSPIPYVWSDQLGHRIQTLGLPMTGDHFEVVHSEPGRKGEKMVGLYRHDGFLSAAVGIDFPGRLMKYRDLLERRTVWEEALDLAAGLEA
ncbi:MAG TPA: FAD-dependent oxidoreductase [Acidimicrobiales bacterium]|nr:FAD-dependent oxidoreductase [Acidimicrobiales bacterium]